MKRALLLLIGTCLIVHIQLFSLKRTSPLWRTGRQLIHKNPYSLRNLLTKPKIERYGTRFYTQSVPSKGGWRNWFRNKWGGLKSKQWIPGAAGAGTVGLGLYGYYKLMKPSVDIEIIQDAIQKKDLFAVFRLIEEDPQSFREAFDGASYSTQVEFIKTSFMSADKNTLKYILSALVKKDTTEKRISLLRSLINGYYFKGVVLQEHPKATSIIHDFRNILEKVIKEEARS